MRAGDHITFGEIDLQMVDAALFLVVSLVALAALFWPRLGLRARWQRAQELAARIRREDALKHILKSEANGRVATLNSLAGSLEITAAQAADLLEDLEEHELLTFDDGRLRLRPTGREMGLHVVRRIDSGKATWQNKPACPKSSGIRLRRNESTC